MIRLLFICSLFASSCTESNKKNEEVGATTIHANNTSNQAQVAPTKPADSIMVDIQEKINQAFVQSLMTHKNDALLTLDTQLKELYKVKKQGLIIYWQAYLKFYTAVFYLQEKNKKMSEDEIVNGIYFLKNIKERNAEEYTLLAMLQGFSIQFKNREAVFISADMAENLKHAFSLDPDNIRTCYVFANNDFYTPVKYGGGKQAEKYLLKAVSLPTQKIKNNYLPSWGKEESYELLIRIYIKKGNLESAKKYYKQGLSEFPKSYIINQLAPELVGK